MKKAVLILCTGNSCRSIIAEALINARLGDCVQAFSSGVAASGRVNPLTKKVLQDHDIWQDQYHSKNLDEVMHFEYQLVVTVCDHAREVCPVFPKPVEKIHIGFEDPDGKPYEAFVETYHQIEKKLIPEIRRILC